ncbi:hypothetical protein Dsin_024385 [Dipteronia sinensis]|uniref:Endonuclease/exonuclease/phosphatase domain-containing protein n=1 Tax=Dipteronia sinensis TaxID=43782 RepID=A0AAD9ZTX2_9ROSI|nr:hypothetical protein Dsin_024385 [Dipteronia sinensis]
MEESCEAGSSIQQKEVDFWFFCSQQTEQKRQICCNFLKYCYIGGACSIGPPGIMIGLSWNVRGLGNPRAFAALKRLLKKHSPDFVFLSETKLAGYKAAKFRDNFGFYDIFFVDSTGCSGGLMLLWKKELVVTILSFSAGHIDARIQMEDGFLWRFSGFYGDPVPSNRANSWALLRRLRAVDCLSWVCRGDFNELLCLNVKVEGSDKSISGMIHFRQAIDDCDLIDLGYSGSRLTWNNRRDDKHNVQERLDRFLAGKSWRDRFMHVGVEHLGFNSSDHRPILLKFNQISGAQRVCNCGFRFEPFLLKEEDIGRVIHDSWQANGPSYTASDFICELDNCAARLQGWSKLRFKNLSIQIEEKNREIEMLYKSCGQAGIMSSIKSLEKSV